MNEGLLFIGGTILLAAMFFVRSRNRERASIRTLEHAHESGLAEPASLHPVIDASRCIGCGSCVRACPEGEILGLIEGKAELVEPTRCIGHGACRTSCPEDAIQLVFGTARRGVDIPHVSPDFETNVPGIFIAGELGGMGLIRNAIEQGRQALDSVVDYIGSRREAPIDVVIVGAGPAGFSATLAAKEQGLRHVTLEQDTLGGTVSHFPRGKLVMTAPVKLPLVGKVHFRETTKEKLLAFWESVEQKTQPGIRYNERMQAIRRSTDGTFVVETAHGEYRASAVLLALGRRGTPRTLGVDGEEQGKVVYRLIDPEQYRGQHVLVVGGGDSALEAALALSAEPATTVTLSYRSEAFSRAKLKNRRLVESADSEGKLRVLLSSNVRRIDSSEVIVDQRGRQILLRNDAVIVCAGGVLPTKLLRDAGIEIETHHGRPAGSSR